MPSPATVTNYRFANFEADVRTGELRRDGRRVKLQEKPFQLLLALLERPGELVSHEELQQKLWPKDTFVDFDVGVKVAVKKLRAALGDSAEAPIYIENLPRRGYRFLLPVATMGSADGRPSQGTRPRPAEDAAALGQQVRGRAGLSRRRLQVAVAATALIATVVLTLVLFPPRPAPGAAPGSLAILPFTVIGDSTENQHLGIGMADAAISRLAKLGQLSVRPTSAVRGFGSYKEGPVAAGKRLQVESVLDGHIQRSGERLRVTVQLVRVADGFVLWTEQFDEGFTDILAVQDAIAIRVAAALGSSFSEDQLRSMTRRQSTNAEAYEAYLKGRFFWNRRTEENYVRAIGHFRRATELDPAFAPAYAGLADTYALLGSMANEVIPRRRAMPLARESAQRALQLDETLAEAHTSLAFVYMHYDWNWPAAEREFKRALELHPSYATAHQWYGFWLMAQGRKSEAIESMRRALELDPLSLIINTDLAELLLLSGQYELAIRQCQKTLEMDPSFALAHRILAHAYSRLGRHAEAIAEMERTLDLAGPTVLPDFGYINALAGRTDETQILLEKEQELARSSEDVTWGLAVLHASLRDADETFRWLEEARQQRNGSLIMMKAEPYFQAFAADPRFQKITTAVGLP